MIIGKIDMLAGFDEELAKCRYVFDDRPYDSPPRSAFEAHIKRMRKMLPPVVVTLPGPWAPPSTSGPKSTR